MTHWLLVSSVFAFAALVQSLTGVGYALVAAPLLMMLAPELVPGPLLLLESLLVLWLVIRERHAVDLRILRGALLASLPGAAIGVLIPLTFPAPVIAAVLGVGIIVLSVMALGGTMIPMTRWTMASAGFGAGAMNSIAGIGGPPLALVYRPRDAAELRTNLSLCVLIMSIFSIAALLLRQVTTVGSLAESARYVPTLFVGFFLARAMIHRISAAALARAVLWMSLLAGVSLLFRTK
ncbi:sulfite exporter TauE/SafE family protein [Antrihabitans cavernicola]|uniref:Probable membrane transporter protein n=1 Tax=Antrihabitans cavernicola TaxID=2495913 RepID=A0A5A7S2K2_9NOCA|nr:sulfite exporter TauE/SafE family protein [Spelaeibacter cavernicola]KAA0018391.1 sulfite exporter TauE/SafE family protein [Spelaeibacter cavernicola]